MGTRENRRPFRARLLVAMVMALGVSSLFLPQTAQAASPSASFDHSTDAGTMACYEGLIPGSSQYDGNISTHVYGSACTTRWARIVWDDNNSCCVPLWGKIERQVNGTYGWQTTHTKTLKIEWGNFGTHNTATVPWVQYSDQRFRACWGFGTTTPSTWDCGPFVN
ncbi:hypothetical protein [Micromonospora haikouensis]|uniref:hypothetical protein n=1 Tax=Micromonospora haikouensis TaxID=686309 RepID=UPI003D72F8DB